jgi:hypothetical protein
MKSGMNRTISMRGFVLLAATVLVAGACTLRAQDPSQTNPYEGVSNPPPEYTITTIAPQAKPPAGHPMQAQPAPYGAPQAQRYSAPQGQPQPTSVDPSINFPTDGTDDGIVQVMPSGSHRPGLNQRAYASDPDGDIVHPRPLAPGELGEGTMIRVRLLDRLSTSETEKGEAFRTRVASDVLQNGQVLIPAGSEIDGRVVAVSSGHAGGHGSMRLRPDTVILLDGMRYRLYAEITGTPGSKTHLGGENTIVPDSRLKRDGIEYGGAVGAGAATGALLGGPAGALAGTLVGAGVVTVHLLVSHPQATLEPGTVLLFRLSEPLNLVPAQMQMPPDASVN